MERFVAVCLVLFVVAVELSVAYRTAVSTETGPECPMNISRREVQEALNGISDDLHSWETIKDRLTTRLNTLMTSLHTGGVEDDVASTVSAYLEYIPGVGTLYKASRTFIDSVYHGHAGLNIIGGTIKDLLYFGNFDHPSVVTVHSVFDNVPSNALRRTLNTLMGRVANERVEAAVKRHLADFDFDKKGFLLVHHLEANDPFHNRFVNNRVTMAKYALTKGAVFTGLISYDSYVTNSLIAVIVPHGFEKGAPVDLTFKFDRTWAGKLNHIVQSIGTFGVCEIDITKPDEIEIEILRNEVYYWYTGTVNIGDLEMLGDEDVKEYRLIGGYMELSMFSTDPDLPLGHITRLELLHRTED